MSPLAPSHHPPSPSAAAWCAGDSSLDSVPRELGRGLVSTGQLASQKGQAQLTRALLLQTGGLAAGPPKTAPWSTAQTASKLRTRACRFPPPGTSKVLRLRLCCCSPDTDLLECFRFMGEGACSPVITCVRTKHVFFCIPCQHGRESHGHLLGGPERLLCWPERDLRPAHHAAARPTRRTCCASAVPAARAAPGEPRGSRAVAILWPGPAARGRAHQVSACTKAGLQRQRSPGRAGPL